MNATRLVWCLSYRVLALGIVTLLTIPRVRAEMINGNGFDIHFTPSEILDRSDVDAVADEVEKGIAFLSEFFGKPLPAKVRIEILPRGLASVVYIEDSRITYPASRISRTKRFRDPSIVHDLSILFEHARNEEHKGALTIGLAVYLQAKFAPGKNIYPTGPAPLHEETARVMNVTDWVIPMKETTAVRLDRRKARIGRRLAMLEQGSFVAYLVESLGKEKFMRLYRGEAFEKVYGMRECEAHRDWFAHLLKVEPSLSRLSASAPACPKSG